MSNLLSRLDSLGSNIDGELKHDTLTRAIYSTDASAYREEAYGRCMARNVSDIEKFFNLPGRRKQVLQSEPEEHHLPAR